MSTPTILFVGDEPFIIMAFRQVFKREPYHLLTAMSASEALGLLAQQPVDVLITDNRMPGMTGIQLLREARKSYPGVYRILMSGQMDEKRILRANDGEDVQRMIYKPWDVDELQSALREILAAQELRKTGNGGQAANPAR